MKMVLVLWDRFIWVQFLIYIDQQMLVTCVWRVDAGGRNTHARETKLHPKRTGDGVTVLRADDIDKGIGRASGLSQCNGKAADYQDDKEPNPTATEKSTAPVLAASRALLSAPRIMLTSGFYQRCR